MATGTNGIATGGDLNALVYNGKYFTDTTKCPTKSEILAKNDNFSVSNSSNYSSNQCVLFSDVVFSSGSHAINFSKLTVNQNGSNKTPFSNFSGVPFKLTITILNKSVTYTINKNSGTVDPSPTYIFVPGQQVTGIGYALQGYTYAYSGVPQTPDFTWSMSVTNNGTGCPGTGGAKSPGGTSPSKFDFSGTINYTFNSTSSPNFGFTLNIICNN